MLVSARGGKVTSRLFVRSNGTVRAAPPSTRSDHVPGSTSQPVIVATTGFVSRL